MTVGSRDQPQQQQTNVETSNVDIKPISLAVHPKGVYCFAKTECMRWVFTGGEDGVIRKFDYFASLNGKTKLTQTQMHGLPDTVWRAGVLLGSWDNEEGAGEEEEEDESKGGIMPPTGQPVQPMPPKAKPEISPVYSLAVEKNALWAMSDINMWSVRHDQGTCFHTLKGHSAPVSLLRLIPGERLCVSGSWDKSLALWDLNSGTIVMKYVGHQAPITSLFFLEKHESNMFISTAFDGISYLWDSRQPQPARKFDPADYKLPPWCLSACASESETSFFCGRRNETIDEWDIGTAKQIQHLKMPANSGPVSSVKAFNSSKLLCGSIDNIRLWDLEFVENPDNLVPFRIIPGHHGGILSDMVLDGSRQFLITISGDRGLVDYPETKCCLFYHITNYKGGQEA